MINTSSIRALFSSRERQNSGWKKTFHAAKELNQHALGKLGKRDFRCVCHIRPTTNRDDGGAGFFSRKCKYNDGKCDAKKDAAQTVETKLKLVFPGLVVRMVGCYFFVGKFQSRKVFWGGKFDL